VDPGDNELLILESIHMFVVMLDVTFQNVSELDIIFRFDEAFQILHEFIIAGEMQETSKRRILRIIEKQNQVGCCYCYLYFC
jgi:AP-1 complex subunit sigma 1/2